MMIIKVITEVVVERERDLGRIRRGCCLRFLVFRIQVGKKNNLVVRCFVVL
jgi:hypothetical protein